MESALAAAHRAETALSLAQGLRAAGFEPAAIRVGDVSFDLVIRTKMPAPVSNSTAPAMTPVVEYLGAQGADMLKDRDDDGDE